ncbi:KTR2 [Symbiodinium sp. CCMP2456]|nr:KTR2 [Symbiodinium sp. CCMP2456]
MSLDTDSMFTEDVETDPIEAMHQNKSLVLGYSHLMISNGAYMKGLWTATLPYLTYRGVKLAGLLQQNWHFLSRFLVPYVGHHTQEVMYSNLVVMTDLELLRISFFRPGSEYFRFYRYLDELGGFWEHRWGDHAVRGLGAGIALLPHERDPAEANETTIPLMAYDLKLPYAHQGSCFCQTPGRRCEELGQAASGEALWPVKKKVWACVPNVTAISL